MPRAGDPVKASDVAVQACRVTRGAALSVASGTGLTTVAFTSEEYDTDGMHDTVTNNSRITIQTAGFYILGFNGTFAAAATYQRVFARLLVNATLEIARDQKPGTGLSFSGVLGITTAYRFVVGDYIEVQVSQSDSGAAARNLEANPDYSPEFWAARLGS